MRSVGRSVPRLGERARVAGHAAHGGDRPFRGELTMRVVRSPAAFGALRAVDSADALSVPGVVAVWTAKDVALIPPLPYRLMAQASLDGYRQPILARDMVRYVGEPVAAVFALSPAAAEDALERIALDVEVFDPALAPPFDAAANGAAAASAHPVEATVVRKSYGDLHSAFHEADHVVERRFAIARDAVVPLELRSARAHWDEARDVLHFEGAAKAPHAFRDTLAAMLSRPPSSVAVSVPPFGGGFGQRGELEAEDVLACQAALTLRRPVRWSEDRREHLTAASEGRGAVATLRAAANADGRVLAIDAKVALDQGAYLRPPSVAAADLLLAALPGPYRLDAYRGAAHVMLTNTVPCALMRGAGRMEATFLRERMMDALAATLGLAPDELRRRNFLAFDAPVERPVSALGRPVILDSARYQDLVDEAVRHFSVDLMRRRAQERRLRGELVGVGTSFGLDVGVQAAADRVTLALDTAGHLELVTGAASFGQGAETALAQIVGDMMGVEPARVRVTCGDTTRLARGVGSEFSQTTSLTGTAALLAAEALRERVLRAGAAILGVPAERLTIQSGRVREADQHFGNALELGALAAAMEPGAAHAPADGRGAFAQGIAQSVPSATGYGFAAAMVEVDAFTGAVRVLRTVAAREVGNAINPALAEAQVTASVAEGIAAALFTRRGTDAGGTPKVQRLHDYKMPTFRDLGEIGVLLAEAAPAPGTPLGVKGVGDGAVGAVGAAIAAAVDDALGAPGFAAALPIGAATVRAHLREHGTPHPLGAGAPVLPSHSSAPLSR